MPRKTAPGQARIHDVAEAAGVSLMTVSRSVRGLDGVSETTRSRVLAIAQKLNYIPNSNARALASTHTPIIGISLPTLFNDVFADVLSGMRSTFEQAGYATIVETSDYDPERDLSWAERTLGFRPAAMILTGCDHAPDLRPLLLREQVPTLEIWDTTDDPIDICVGIDHFAEGSRLGQYAVSLGYRAPAFVGAPEGFDRRADKRAAGIALAFAEAGAKTLERVRVTGTNAFAMGAEGMARLRGHDRDVAFFLSDHLAFGGIMALEREGGRVPADMGVVGFNGVDLTAVLPRTMTTMVTPRRKIGVVGARHLLARLNNVNVAKVTRLTSTLVEGETLQHR
ncbi:MAG: LacI family DNA-binding transcriptional regulator [Pseudomonadota bacterium]